MISRVVKYSRDYSIYAICGFNDFFVTTHVVAVAQHRADVAYIAGYLLALIGRDGLQWREEALPED